MNIQTNNKNFAITFLKSHWSHRWNEDCFISKWTMNGRSKTEKSHFNYALFISILWFRSMRMRFQLNAAIKRICAVDGLKRKAIFMLVVAVVVVVVVVPWKRGQNYIFLFLHSCSVCTFHYLIVEHGLCFRNILLFSLFTHCEISYTVSYISFVYFRLNRIEMNCIHWSPQEFEINWFDTDVWRSLTLCSRCEWDDDGQCCYETNYQPLAKCTKWMGRNRPHWNEMIASDVIFNFINGIAQGWLSNPFMCVYDLYDKHVCNAIKKMSSFSLISQQKERERER